MSFAGIDRLGYPGNDFMNGLMNNTNLLWTGFYLAPAPSQGNTSWMAHLVDLRAMGPGWGVAPIYVGQQHPSIDQPGVSHIRTAEQGRIDALNAAELADRAGFSSGSEANLTGSPRIYLDIEIGGNLPREDLAYVNAWCATIRSDQTAYLPGVYCSFKDTAAQLKRDNPDLVFWVFNLNHHEPAMPEQNVFAKPDLTLSGVPDATAWQWVQGFASITTTLPDGSGQTLRSWDLDVSAAPDPSHPDRKFDPDTGTWLD
jgi:hypothetical protein